MRPGMSVRGSRIQTLSGGEIGNVGMNVAKTAAPLSTRNGSSLPPKARMSVSSNPFSTGCRSPATAGSLPAFGPSNRERSSGVNRK